MREISITGGEPLTRKKTALSNKILRELNDLKRKYDNERFSLLPALYLFQREYGWLSAEALEKVGEILGVPKTTVKSVSTFYAMFRHKPMGRHLIQLCTNVSCMIMGCERLTDILKTRYGLGPNATTHDGRFSFLVMECIGVCDIAPAMVVDTDLYGNLTEDSLIGILERYE
ncbi:MAG: NADH-quinone oxidoreductase subunit NuoE [Nitrospirae bacterium]|nr:NADH-quinone oxidoreductase subunit NuoE [Nitrospirota bacterium]